eukprot:CAMPEP_0118714754 /NCGR_PEP_ID=MMETSP0800-20121206/26403_1 /TAXON_ID=210618 ORGANISM="Striatella unipunctata, Strain CCMP2910" /NCGR_SAMPLE_ID=MMETSP0800 /ASSEMBLY_ACC=CAM_ASM_000638 /LENGTH=194 /DNA_ID=CAMNT_0006620663 /DNA_START=258 /DNA_END=842 /DNA_ORIENTATION=-
MAGCQHFIAPILGLAGLALAVAANFLCAFVGIEAFKGNLSIKFGIWQLTRWSAAVEGGELEFSESCVQYPEEIGVDSTWQAARAFSILSPIVAFTCIVAAAVSICANLGKTGWNLIGLGFLFAAFFQGLTFLILQSNLCSNDPILEDFESITGINLTINDCQLEWEAYACIAAVVTYVLTSLLMFATSAPNKHF